MTTPHRLLSIVALALLARAASAADISLPGTKLVLKSGRSQKLTYRYKGPIGVLPGRDVDPKLFGATLRVVNPNSGETIAFGLPAAHWSGPDTDAAPRWVRKYRDPRGAAGPVKTVVLKPAKGLKLVARSTGITVDEPAQGAVGLVLSLNGTLNYCSVFGGTIVKDVPGAFVARGAVAPPLCPGTCGNGVVDDDEECEGAGTGQCPAGSGCTSCRCIGVGDVSIQLHWNTVDDLDVHVIDPTGEEIWWDNMRAATGGRLDEDANRGCTGEATPLENVFWPLGTAPHGQYTVLVHLYRICTGTPMDVPFTVRTLVDGVVTDHPGVLTDAPSCPGTCGECGVCTQVVQFTR